MTDIEIARSIKPKHITKIAKKLGLKAKDLIFYGDIKAKIKSFTKKATKQKLILVTAINPTKAGNGKTTVSIGLADAFSHLRQKVCLALREPSLGPVFGIKGGATGGGFAQVLPMEDINLHFNGDFHAITSANNLLCSLIDNHIFQGNELNIDPSTIEIHRCLDLNERALRNVHLDGLGYERTDHFTITSASEIMAIMCLAQNLEDLKNRLGNMFVGLTFDKQPVYAKQIGGIDAVAILLKDALLPNLVQTLEGTPAIIHCGPFANIAHGCNSITATKTAMSLADYTITEAGFGADLGAEKFIDFKCRKFGLNPDCVVLVATIRALKLHGGEVEENLAKPNLDALKKGLENLIHHANVIKNVYNLPLVITLNKYATDTQEEIDLVTNSVEDVVINNVWGQGGAGAIDLAKRVLEKCEHSHEIKFAYNLDDSVETKITDIVRNVYGGAGIELSDKAKEAITNINKLGLDKLPIIVAKTQFSLTADKNIMGAPKDFVVNVRDIEIRSGAGFLVAICGNMLLMPALSKTPAALNMIIDNITQEIFGLF